MPRSFTIVPSLFLALFLTLSLACGGSSTPDHARDALSAPDTAAIRSQEERLRQAMVGGDTATLASLWAPEYLSTSAVGHTSDRAQSLMAYGGGLVNVDTAVVRDVEIRFYGTTAVALGMMDWSGSAAGRAFGGTVRFQHVWAHADGAWRLVASQLTSQP